MKLLADLHEGLPIIEFQTSHQLHNWLLANENHNTGIWVRIYKTQSGVDSVSFQDLLEEGLCFGWSESLRHAYDSLSYLQKFTPRKSQHTQSERNLALVKRLALEERMRPSGYQALGLPLPD